MELSFRRRWVDDDGMLEVDFSIAHGGYSTYQNFYVYPEDLGEFGRCLENFGSSANDETVLEIGSPEEGHYCWVRFRAYQYDPIGHSAIEISTQRNGAPQIRARCQFSVPMEIAAINELGAQIQMWSHKNDLPLSFEVYCG